MDGSGNSISDGRRGGNCYLDRCSNSDWSRCRCVDGSWEIVFDLRLADDNLDGRRGGISDWSWSSDSNMDGSGDGKWSRSWGGDWSRKVIFDLWFDDNLDGLRDGVSNWSWSSDSNMDGSGDSDWGRSGSGDGSWEVVFDGVLNNLNWCGGCGDDDWSWSRCGDWGREVVGNWCWGSYGDMDGCGHRNGSRSWSGNWSWEVIFDLWLDDNLNWFRDGIGDGSRGDNSDWCRSRCGDGSGEVVLDLGKRSNNWNWSWDGCSNWCGEVVGHLRHSVSQRGRCRNRSSGVGNCVGAGDSRADGSSRDGRDQESDQDLQIVNKSNVIFPFSLISVTHCLLSSSYQWVHFSTCRLD